MGRLKAELEKEAYEGFVAALENASDDRFLKPHLDATGAQIQSIILLRTARGKFLPGSKMPAQYSAGHAKRRERLGLATDKVSLFMGQGGMLEAMGTRVVRVGGKISLDVGYIPGISESGASEIAGYLNTEGAGKNKVKYTFIGLTGRETNTVTERLSARMSGSIAAFSNR